ncbi:MAG: type IV pilus assembly protein PilM [Halanaerobiales bacterium]
MFFMSKEYTCIDIGTNSIKAVQFKAKKDKLKLIDIGIQKLPPKTIVDGLIVDDSMVASELQSLLKSLKNKPKNIITTVPNDNLLIRNIEMPAMDKKEIRESLKWEADEQLPYPVENAALDYLKIEEDEESIKYIVAAVKKNVVDNYLDPFKRLNLKPKVINVQPMALVSLLDFQNEIDSNIAVVDIGASATQITIANNKNIMLSRTIDTGGSSFTNSIMETMDLDYQSAEEKKAEININLEANSAEDPSEEFLDSMPIGMEIESGTDIDLTDISTRLSSEVTRSLDFFNMKHRDKEVEKIFITGGASRLTGLKQLISDEIGREMILIDPFKNINRKLNNEGEELVEQFNYEFAVAVGLAVSEVMVDES